MALKLLALTFCLLCLCLCLVNAQLNDEDCCEEYCYSRDEEPYLYYGTKTAYDSLNRMLNNHQHIIPECHPIQFWSLNRHGTRLPSARTIERLRRLESLHEQVLRNHEQLKSYPYRGRLCNEDFDLFRRWRWNNSITEQKANSLTSQGIEDMRLLATRYKSKFKEIFSEPPSNDRTYSFQYADSDRTHDSYQAYIEGLFGNEAYRVHANTFGDEKLIKPYNNCEAWEENVERNPGTKSEYVRFTESPEYQKMVRHVFRRLGFRFTLNSSIINDIYDLCRYEKAWNINLRSPWCIAFNKEQLKLLEYAEDLKYYYKTGYGNSLSEKIGCAPVKDLYYKFERTVLGQNEGNKGSFYFTHSATLQSVLTTMGIAKDYDNPLTADNYYQQSRRQWRTSLLDPFAANLVAVLYECRNGERHRVMFFLNEHPVDFPDCSVGLCNWSVVKEKFQNIAESCDVEGFCSGSSASRVVLVSSTVYIAIISAILYFKF